MAAATLAKTDAREVVEAYCAGVMAGEVIACKWVKLAVKRHVQDLKTGAARGLWFDWDEAQRVVDFFGLLHHSKGRWAGGHIILEPWQVFIESMIFGWRMKGSNLRRFRTAYEEVARKNGKSTRVAGEGLYAMLMDREEGAEVYSAATKRDQARITHIEATRMVRKSPYLKRQVRIFKDNLSVERTNSKYEALGADANTLDGLNPHWCNVDEVHAHRNRELWDVLETGTGARSQPMMRAITTAGFNRAESICMELRSYATQVLEGTIQDDTFFAIIFTLDEGDDWKDEKVWMKSNPNLGVSVDIDDLRRKAKKAGQSPSAQNNFRCKHMNEWTEQEVRFLDMLMWERCMREVKEEDLLGKTCFAGLDLSSTTDFTALALYFPDPCCLLVYFWLPEKAIERSDAKHVDALRNWAGEGKINLTDGNEVDQKTIIAFINSVSEKFDVRKIVYDPWNATGVTQPLAESGAPLMKFAQTYPNMNEPTKKFRALIESGTISVGKSPVLRWMASNTAVKEHESGAIRPVKPTGVDVLRIDGIVASIMALGVSMAEAEPAESHYESHELEMA